MAKKSRTVEQPKKELVEVKHIGVLSAAKVFAILYAIMGFVIGLIYTFFGVLALVVDGPGAESLFLLGSVVYMPILYAALTFIGTALAAWLYNVLAARVGGVRMRVRDTGARQ